MQYKHFYRKSRYYKFLIIQCTVRWWNTDFKYFDDFFLQKFSYSICFKTGVNFLKKITFHSKKTFIPVKISREINMANNIPERDEQKYFEVLLEIRVCFEYFPRSVVPFHLLN